MRNKYSKEFEEYTKINSTKYTKEKLRKKLEKKFDVTISKTSFEKYLYRHNIRCVDYDATKVRSMNKAPIGYEYTKDDGMTLVKIAQPNKWEYKQRVIYKQYYNCELDDNDYIIFLNQNRSDFRISNLKKVTRKESSYLSNQQMFSKNKKLTELGVLTAKLMIKSKEVARSDRRKQYG